MYKLFITLAVIACLLVLGTSLSLAQQEFPVTPNNANAQDGNNEIGPAHPALIDDMASAPLIARSPFKPQLPVIIEAPVETELEITTQTTTGTTEGDQLTTGQTALPEEEPGIVGVPKLTITGLIWNSDRPQAIVNGNIVEVGDRLFGIPTDKAETIPEITFSNITKEGLEVSFMEKTVILKPIDAELEQSEE